MADEMTATMSTITSPPPSITTSPAQHAAMSQTEINARQTWLKAHMELGKVRLNAMVVFTTALGYVVGAQLKPTPGVVWSELFWTCLGTFLAAVGASAFNQAIEARRDARMHRTRNRPLCTGRLTRTYAAAFGLIISMCGVVLLFMLTNWLAALLAAANVALYALIYTPLKPVSTANTLVGAIVGGVPPMLGWVAASGSLSAGAVVLGAILFVWQVPHFLALCWMYREDYARGGFRMLPIVDPTGRSAGRLALIYACLLMPLCLLMVGLQHASVWFGVVSFVLTAGMVIAAARFALTRGNRDARRLFFASIIYLPLVSMALMADARSPMGRMEATPHGYLFVPDKIEPFVDPGSAEGHKLQESVTPAAPKN